MKVKSIGNRFKVSRINAGYTQRDVHKILGYLSFQALSQYEKDISIPSNMVLYSLPKLYNVSLDYLLCQDDYRSHEEYITDYLRIPEDVIPILKRKLDNNPINLENFKIFLQYLIERKENNNGYWRNKG